jgi:hypothetical protein
MARLFHQLLSLLRSGVAIETIESRSALVGIGRVTVYVCRLREERADQSRYRRVPAGIGVQKVQTSDPPMLKIPGELMPTDEPMPCIADEAADGHQRLHKIQLAGKPKQIWGLAFPHRRSS